MTHDYKRNGTATLLAALKAANGEVYGVCQERQRDQESLNLLRSLDTNHAGAFDLRLIADNYATHKHPRCSTGFTAIRSPDQRLVAQHGGAIEPTGTRVGAVRG